MGWSDWTRGLEVEPSLYGADLAHLGDQVEALLDAGCRVFHFDVGDGHFVEPITMGPIVLQSIAPVVHAVDGAALDCHLMVDNPTRHFPQIARAGPIQVDGGIDNDNVRAVYEAGATLIVAGTAIFGREDVQRSYRRLVQA